MLALELGALLRGEDEETNTEGEPVAEINAGLLVAVAVNVGVVVGVGVFVGSLGSPPKAIFNTRAHGEL